MANTISYSNYGTYPGINETYAQRDSETGYYTPIQMSYSDDGFSSDDLFRCYYTNMVPITVVDEKTQFQGAKVCFYVDYTEELNQNSLQLYLAKKSSTDYERYTAISNYARLFTIDYKADIVSDFNKKNNSSLLKLRVASNDEKGKILQHHNNTLTVMGLNNSITTDICQFEFDNNGFMSSLKMTYERWGFDPFGSNITSFFPVFMNTDANTPDLYVDGTNTRTTTIRMIVIEPNEYMKTYFKVKYSKKHQLNCVLSKYNEISSIMMPSETKTLCDSFQYTKGSTISNDLINNDVLAKTYKDMSSTEQSAIKSYCSSAVNTSGINCDSGFRSFCSSVNNPQDYEECGCYMPESYMNNYWNTFLSNIPENLRGQVQRKVECFYNPCVALSTVKNSLILSGKTDCPNVVNCFQFSTINFDNTGSVVGNVNVNNDSICSNINTATTAPTIKTTLPTTLTSTLPTTSPSHTTTSMTNSTPIVSKKNNSSLIIGIVVAVIAFLIFIGILAYVWSSYPPKNSKSKSKKSDGLVSP